MKRDPEALVSELERRLEELELLPDASAREQALGVVQALLELYGAGLERIVEAIAQRDTDGELARTLATDELVAHLLLVHGLHPLPVARRVADALHEVRPYLESHGGDVELLAIEADTVRVRLRGSCNGCASSQVTLKLAIEEAIAKTAPEIVAVVADEPAGARPESGLLQIEPSPQPLLQIECPIPR